MNRDKIDKLEGQALRDAIATEVMGWYKEWSVGGGYWKANDDNREIGRYGDFQPDLSMNDAMRVLGKVQERGFDRIDLQIAQKFLRTGVLNSCTMKDMARGVEASCDFVSSLPIAICRAALKAVRSMP